MSDHTLEAPPLQIPEAPPRTTGRPAENRLFVLARRYPWVLGAIALLLVSFVVVLWAGVRPGYDPYGWLTWGKLTIHGNLDTNGAPSWKPLPFLFTVPFALFGKYQLWLWMVTSVAISLAGPVFAWRIAFRLTNADPARRYASYVAGLSAAVVMLLMQDPIAPASYIHYLLSAESDTMIVALCLAAVDCHLSGRHRWAFWMWWLASLGRPEVWPYYGLAGIWLWVKAPGYRRWLITSVVLLLILWFGIPGLTSKSFLTAGNIAQNSPRAIHGNKVTGVITRFHQLQGTTVWIASLLAIAVAAFRRNRTVLVLAAGAVFWVLIEIAFALHGWPAVPRYLFEPGAVFSVLAGVFIGWLILELPGLLAAPVRRVGASRISSPLATRLGAWGTVIVLAVIAGTMFGTAHRQYRLERVDLSHERARALEIGRLSVVIQKLGAARILACGQPNIPIGYQSQFGWYADVKIGALYVSPTYERKHPHPLVNFNPHSNGWDVAPSLPRNVSAATAARCSGLTLKYRS
jgi:hypothetical protein